MDTPARFRISWVNSEYKVSIPNYQGGEVVRAEIADAWREALDRLVHCATDFPSAFPRMIDQARALLRASEGKETK